VVYGSWFEHTLGWRANIQESAGNVLVLHYEDMQQDLATHIRRLGALLGKHLSPQAVAAIADYASFASMSADPFTNREGNPLMDFSIARFLRKGVVGDWKNHFTAEQDARFEAVWEQKMSGTALSQYFAM
jgi:Sulfotransferase domain